VTQKRKNLIKKIRFVAIAMACGICLLSLQSLVTGLAIFQDFAIALAVLGLILITFMLAKAVTYED